MSNTAADLPPYDPQRIIAAPFPERVRLVCRSWAAQVSPNPMIVLVMYWAKYLLLFAGGWAFFVSFSAGYPGFGAIGEWAFSGIAFQKAILWAIFYETAGFGCSSGPMNGRFKPPIGGFLYFLRPGTTKLPLFEEVLKESGLAPEQIGYIGDDLTDLPLMRRCGLAAAPADSTPEVLEAAHFVSAAAGGDGAVRHVVELLLVAQNRWDEVLAKYYI